MTKPQIETHESDEIATSYTFRPVYPAATLTNSFPTVNGVVYDCWADALEAKQRGMRLIKVDLFGREID